MLCPKLIWLSASTLTSGKIANYLMEKILVLTKQSAAVENRMSALRSVQSDLYQWPL